MAKYKVMVIKLRCFSRKITDVSRDVTASTSISTQMVSETKYMLLSVCQIANLGLRGRLV